MSLVHFLSWKILPHPCTTKSIRNRSLQQYSRMLFFKKFQRFRLWSGYGNKLLSPSKCFHRSVCNSTPHYKLCTCLSLKSRSKVPSPVW